MLLLRLIEFFLCAILLVFLVSDIIVPAWRGKPLFPTLRKRQKLEGELSEAKEALREVGVEEKIRNAEKEIAARRKKTQSRSQRTIS